MPYHSDKKDKKKKKPMKKKPVRKKPVLKVRKGMTQNQRDKLQEHAKHHTSQHMAIMIKEMKAGASFTKSHKKALKMVGK